MIYTEIRFTVSFRLSYGSLNVVTSVENSARLAIMTQLKAYLRVRTEDWFKEWFTDWIRDGLKAGHTDWFEDCFIVTRKGRPLGCACCSDKSLWPKGLLMADDVIGWLALVVVATIYTIKLVSHSQSEWEFDSVWTMDSVVTRDCPPFTQQSCPSIHIIFTTSLYAIASASLCHTQSVKL